MPSDTAEHDASITAEHDAERCDSRCRSVLRIALLYHIWLSVNFDARNQSTAAGGPSVDLTAATYSHHTNVKDADESEDLPTNISRDPSRTNENRQ